MEFTARPSTMKDTLLSAIGASKDNFFYLLGNKKTEVYLYEARLLGLKMSSSSSLCDWQEWFY